MPSEPPLGAEPDKLSLLVLSGAFERVHYALVLASAAAALGKPATLFFTDRALYALMAAEPGGVAGWRSLAAGGAVSAGEADRERRNCGVAGFEELLAACVDLGVRFIACEMGLRAIGIVPSRLRDDVPIEVAGVVTFLADASAGGAVLTL